MKIIVAPDSYKGSSSAVQVALLIEKGIKQVLPHAEIVKIPIADGGEGTVDAFLYARGGRRITYSVCGPLGERVSADYGILPDGTAVIEMAAASGLPLILHEKRNPLAATSRGTGELILSALDQGCRKIVMGIGVSATNDGGESVYEYGVDGVLSVVNRPMTLSEAMTASEETIPQAVETLMRLVKTGIKMKKRFPVQGVNNTFN